MATPSKERIKGEVVQYVDAALTKLQQLWNEIGIGDEQRKDRADTVRLHVRNLLENIVEEEDVLKQTLQHNVEAYTEEVCKLGKELSLSAFKPDKSLSLLVLEQTLRNKVDSLSREKHDRLKVLKKYSTQDQALCDTLCTTPYYIPSGSVPSKQQLEDLEKHIAASQREKENRQAEFLVTKVKITEILSDIECSADTTFERDILCEDENSFPLSTENMKSLQTMHAELEERRASMKSNAENLLNQVRTLWDRLATETEDREQFLEENQGYKSKTIEAYKAEISRCNQLKLQNIQRFIDGMRSELVTWWEKCYFSKDQRDEFKAAVDEDYTEELLEVHDQEVQKMRRYYEVHQEMFEQILKREKLYLEMLEFERKAADPNRFNNRGGGLLQEEKARKKIIKELPKVENMVKEVIMKWEKENEKDFLVDGVRFVDYIRIQWENYHKSKAKEKDQRTRAKAKITEEEMIFGSRPTTPAKRRFAGTPTKSTPVSKMRKMNNVTKTPMSFSRIQTPGSVPRMHCSAVFASPSPFRVPKSDSKLTPKRKNRRSSRVARKVLTERNSRGGNSMLFSHTTVSSGVSSVSNASLASMGSYQDFSTGLNPSSRPFCRSSIALKPPTRR